jgi:hypothetical protein
MESQHLAHKQGVLVNERLDMLTTTCSVMHSPYLKKMLALA